MAGGMIFLLVMGRSGNRAAITGLIDGQAVR
jgi:hypothetical protein